MGSSNPRWWLGAAIAGAVLAACQPMAPPSGPEGAPAARDLRAYAPGAPGFRLLAAPSNDDLPNATPLVVDGVARTLSLADATSDPGDPAPACWGSVVEQSVWYVYTAPEGGPPIIDLDASGSDYPPNLFTFEDTSEGLAALGCIWEGGDNRQVRLQLHVEPGRTYYILSGSLFGHTGGQLTLAARPNAPTEATLYVNPKAAVNPQTGEVTISGTVTANQPIRFGVSGQLVQRSGRILIRGDFSTSSPSTHYVSGVVPWSATARAQPPYFFGPGKVQATIQGLAGAYDFVFFDVQSELRLTATK